MIFRDAGLRYFFYSNEGSPREAPHVHVKGGGCDAKIRLAPEPAVVDNKRRVGKGAQRRAHHFQTMRSR